MKFNFNPKRMGLIGAGVLVFSVFFEIIGFTQVLHFCVRDQTALKKRNMIRGIYLKLPFPLTFNVYFFNITNPEEVQRGGKPIVKEVGPWSYDEYKEKIDVIDNDIEDTLTYSPYDTFKFNPENSGTNREDDYVTILNPLVVGIVNQVNRDSPPLLNIINKAIKSIFNDPKTIYLTIKVKDVLFDGAEINCDVKDFSSKAVCTQMKTQVPGLKTVKGKKNVYLFSLLGPRNATLGKRTKVKRGIKKSRDTGALVEYDGKKTIGLWGSTFCNRYKGTDGWIFPPLLKKEEGLWSFSTDLCRNIGVEYVRDVTYRGMNLRYYEATLGDQINNEEDKCYCPKEGCLKKGVFDLSKCMGVPIYATLPHFLHTDPSYLNEVSGLKPDPVEHSVFLYFEPLTATPLYAKKRMQFNLPINTVKKIDLMQNITPALHPVFWIEESVQLEGSLFKLIKSISVMIKVVHVINYLGMAGGAGAMGLGGFLFFKNRQSVDIQPVSTKSSTPSSSSSRSEDQNEKNGDLSKNDPKPGIDNKGYINNEKF